MVKKLVPQVFVEHLPVQILVVVARSQMKILKIDVEKGSTLTMFGHGLAGPENQGCSSNSCIASQLDWAWC